MSLLLSNNDTVTSGSSTVQAAGTVDPLMTPELDLLVRRGAWIGQGDSDNPVVSFTSLFLSFLVSTDGVSTWVQDKITWIGPALADVVRRWNSGRTVSRGLDEKRVQAAHAHGQGVAGGPDHLLICLAGDGRCPRPRAASQVQYP